MKKVTKIEARKGDAMKEQLLAVGSKATPGRLQVLSILQKSDRPLNVQDIMNRLKGRINQVTVYRILNTLRDAGLVRQVDFLKTHAYFELADRHGHHHHLFCVKCQKIEDFAGCDFDSIIEKALKKSKQFKQISQHSLELFGLCNNCVKEIKK
jgi:Fe2+ or Zn2+ uptake regulation protein